MRLIGTVSNESEARKISKFLSQQGIANHCEWAFEEGINLLQIWIENEDQLKDAMQWFALFKEDPESSRFKEEVREGTIEGGKRPKAKYTMPKASRKVGLTKLILYLCIALFIFNGFQKSKLLKEEGAFAYSVALTPLEQALFFDYPLARELLGDFIIKNDVKSLKDVKRLPESKQRAFVLLKKKPIWQGLIGEWFEGEGKDAPLFEKIRQGQIWRFITPIFLHGGFLHILFNMLWAWYLGKQVEPRLGKGRMILLILMIGALSNTAQYFVSGANFLGYSGVVCGLAAFIFVRQKFAPWEGYPMSRGTFMFILTFVLVMTGIELVSLLGRVIMNSEITQGIANTAHISGGIVGGIFGRLPFFARRGV